jgi:hypothetical protein
MMSIGLEGQISSEGAKWLKVLAFGPPTRPA